jgi:HSP20 family protein
MFLVPMTRSASPLARSFDRLFDDDFDRFFSLSESAGARSAALDVAESERDYTVTLDVPGVAKDDVKISIDGKRVSIEAQQRKEADKKDGERIVYRERSVARFSRAVTLPAELDEATSTAKLENGVLTLTLAKKQPAQPRRITVN